MHKPQIIYVTDKRFILFGAYDSHKLQINTINFLPFLSSSISTKRTNGIVNLFDLLVPFYQKTNMVNIKNVLNGFFNKLCHEHLTN